MNPQIEFEPIAHKLLNHLKNNVTQMRPDRPKNVNFDTYRVRIYT